MPGPTLTPTEIAQVTAEKNKQIAAAAALTAAIPQKAARAAEYAVTDGAFKKFFDYYNDDIIGKYDNERKALNGQYIASPITEADILGPATVDGSVRTTPTTPVTDIVRVAEFDGGPLIVSTTNESQHISDQASLEDALVNGYGAANFNTLTALTDSALSSLSTTVKIKDPTNPINIVTNDIFVIYSLSDMAVVKVTTVTPDPGSPPPYEFTYGITFIIPPTGTIPIGSSLTGFTGFTNSERTTKTATNPSLQNLMNFLISGLQGQINNRKARLTEELAALSTNQDPDGISAIAAATTNVNTSNSFLTSYLITTDISNTGLASLASERATRGVQITTRVAQIVAAYTGQTLNYFDQRYTYANNRANTAHGSLRLQKATEQSATQLGAYVAGANDAISAFNSILP